MKVIRLPLTGTLLLLLLATGCTTTYTDPAEFQAAVRNEDWPYRYTHDAGDFVLDLRYIPREALLLQEYGNVASIPARLEREAQLTFQLRIHRKDGRDLVQAAGPTLLSHLIFGLEDQLHIETDEGQEIPPSLCHLERSFGLQPGRNFVLVFPGECLEEGKTLHIKEFGLGTGNVRFELDPPYDKVKFEPSV